MKLRSALCSVAVSATVFCAIPVAAEAASLHFQAILLPQHIVTNRADRPQGLFSGTLNPKTGLLNFSVSYQNLSGTVTRITFEKAEREDGHIKVKHIRNVPEKFIKDQANPIIGDIRLTAHQVDELADNDLSLTVKTKKRPGGEISGEIREVLMRVKTV